MVCGRVYMRVACVFVLGGAVRSDDCLPLFDVLLGCNSEDEFRQMNKFALSEFSRSWAASGTEPLLYRAPFHPFEHSFVEYGTSMGLV